MALITISEFTSAGWSQPDRADALARDYCQRLEEGNILYFGAPPFPLPADDQQFLLNVRQTPSGVHKNIAYKPDRDRVIGSTKESGDSDALRRVMRSYSQTVSAFLGKFLLPYTGRWQLDFASYRSIEEEGRDLPVSKRNDLLHVDSFPTRPSNGNRILRVFTNLNPNRPRVWLTGEPFDSLVREYGSDAGVSRLAARARSPVRRMLRGAARAVALPSRPPYDEFMLGFHHYLKRNRAFQESSRKSRWEFPPNSTWLVYTDLVPHAVLSGQYALEQTFMISRDALLLPDKAPYRVLEQLAGVSVVD